VKQDAVIFINDSSRISSATEADTVNIDTAIHLRMTKQEEITVVLPEANGHQGRAFLRLVKEVGNRQEFLTSVHPERLNQLEIDCRQKLLAAIEANLPYWDAVKKEAEIVKLATLKLEAGDLEMKLFLQQELKPIDGVFELKFIAPFSNLKVSNELFTMSLVVILPRNGEIVHYEVINSQGRPQPELMYNVERLAVGRQVLLIRSDYYPMFKIRYRYAQ
jgi:hypothetical protein